MGYCTPPAKTRDGTWTMNLKCEQIVACARRVERATPHASQAERLQISDKIKRAHELLNDADAIAARHEPAVLDHTTTRREQGGA